MHDPQPDPDAVVTDHDAGDRNAGRSADPGRYRAAHLAKAERRPEGTLWRPNPREQGLLGLTDAIAFFGARGWSVSIPLIDSQPYDLVVDDDQRLLRVQVKTTTYRDVRGRFVVRLSTSGGNQSFHTRRPFDPAGCDLLYVLTDGRTRYLIPTGAIRARVTLTLGPKVSRYLVAS